MNFPTCECNLETKLVGLRMIAVTDQTPGYPLMTNAPMLRATRRAVAECGVGVLDIEFVRITPEIDIAALEPFLAAGAELGARYVLTAPYDPDLSRLSDRLASLATLAVPYNLRPVLEFFPWTVVPDVATALRVVEATGRDDCGLLVDTLHCDRSGSTLAQLDRVPPDRLPFLHLCDAVVQASYTTEELLRAARAERLPPGEGEIDLLSIISHMPAGIPVGLEVPMMAMTEREGAEAVAKRVLHAARKVMAAASARGD